MAEDNSLLIKINGTAKDFIDELDKVQKKTKELEKVLTATAKASAIAFAAFAGSIALATGAFADYETALVGVGKTTNIEGKKLEDFGKKFQKLSTEIPVATNELLGIAQAAGQLGVSGEKDLLKFTETVAKLGVASDLSGEQAAISLTRILNVTGESIQEIDRFASVLVRLGNNSAASESEIAKVTTEVAKATAQFRIGSTNAVALSAALASMGQQAQLGGSVVGRSFREIEKILRTGGDKLVAFEKLTGQTGDQLKKTFKEDANSVFLDFLESLREVERGGGSISATLETLGLKGDEINKVLPVMAVNFDKVEASMALANDEAIEMNALNKEAAKAFDTLTNRAQQTKNGLVNLAVNIGEKLAPTALSLLDSIDRITKGLANLDDETLSSIAAFLKWGAIITGFIASMATFAIGVIKISAGITALGAAFLPATVTASAFWLAVTGPVGIAIAALAAVTAGVVALNHAAGELETPKTLEAINEQLERLEKKKKLLALPIRLGGGTSAEREKLDGDIKKLEDLKKAKEAASAPVLQSVEQSPLEKLLAPEAPEALQSEEVKDNSLDSLKKSEDAKTEVINEATQKRIDSLKIANAEQLAINTARGNAQTEEEEKFAVRQAEINNELNQAKTIANSAERALALEGLKLKHAEEQAEIDEFESIKDEKRAAKEAERAEIKEALDEENIANRDLLNEEDLLALEEQLLSEDEVKQRFAQEEAARVIDGRNKFLQDEIQYGENIAKAKQLFRNQDVRSAKAGADQLVQLTQSKNDSLNSIGKAAASVRAAISTGEGAIAAYTSLAGIPIVGPALGAAAAGALLAFGVEQQANILGANQGGIVPSGGGRAGVDSVPAMLTPGELVAPTNNFDEVIDGVAAQRGFVNPEAEGESGSSGTITVVIEPKDELINFIEQKIIETQIQNTGVA